jgi:hypothetical protein
LIRGLKGFGHWVILLERSLKREGIDVKLMAGEALWIQEWLQAHGQKLPGVRRFQPGYKADSGNFDEIFRVFRLDAIGFRESIWKAVLERSISGAWPRVDRETAFWLRERWKMAQRLCALIIQKGNNSATRASRPKDAQTTIRWFLLEAWDERLVDLWVREHAREYVYTDYGCPEESIIELEIYLRKLEGKGS